MKLEKWLVAGLVGLAILIRLINFWPSMPFTYDQGRDLLVLQQLSQGDITLIGPTTGLQGVFIGPFMYYFLWPGFILGQGSPLTVAIWNLAWISIAISFSYYLLKPLVGRWAWLGLLLLIFSPGAINDARVIWNPSLAVMTLLPSFYLLFQSQHQDRRWWLLPAAGLYGLALQTELAYAFFMFPLYGWWVWKTKYPAKVLAGAILVGGLTLLPQLVFEIKHGFNMSQAIVNQFTSSDKQVPFSQVWQTRPPIMARAIENTVFGNDKWGNSNRVLVVGLLGTALFLIANKPTKKEEWFLIGSAVLPLTGMMLWRGNDGAFYDYYLNPHYFPLLMVLVLALAKLPKSHQLVGLTATLGIFGISFFQYGQAVFNPDNFQYSIAHQAEALTYIRTQQTTDQPSLEVYVPNLIPTQYRYLNEWMAKAGAAPIDFERQADSDQVFLLYEPTSPGASQEAFNKWYQQNIYQMDCQPAQGFGIITVEDCQPLKSDALPAKL